MIIGLTGKSCSGKNFVGHLLERKGFKVMDLDRECAQLRKEHKDEILRIFGTYDSGELSKIVFSSPEKMHLLEQILYPRLKERILKCNYDLVINGATLYRSGFDSLCRFIIYVDAPFKVRLLRAISRDNITEEEFKKREALQADIDTHSVSYRCPVYVLDNTDCVREQDLDKILTDLQGS